MTGQTGAATTLTARLHHQMNTSDPFLFKDTAALIAGQQTTISILERIAEAASALQVFIEEDNSYSDPNDPDPYAAQVEMGLALEGYDKGSALLNTTISIMDCGPREADR